MKIYISEQLSYRVFKIILDGNNDIRVICRYEVPNKDPSNWFFIKRSAEVSPDMYLFFSQKYAQLEIDNLIGDNEIVELYGITEERFLDKTYLKNCFSGHYEFSPFEMPEICIAKINLPFPSFGILKRVLDVNTGNMGQWKKQISFPSVNEAQANIKIERNKYVITTELKRELLK